MLWLLRAAGVAAQTAACPLVPQVGQVYYVRACGGSDPVQCNDGNAGDSPTTAWATISHAAAQINMAGNPGDTVIVGPGVYDEGDIDLEQSGAASRPDPNNDNQQITIAPISFIGDPTGMCTGDSPGPVLIDVPPVPNPGEMKPPDTGFLVFGASDVVIAGFQITHAPIAAVQIRPGRFGRSADRVEVANNVLFGNGEKDIGRGVDVTDVDAPTVFNNLIYGNVSTGVGILSTTHARIINNTIYGGVDGVVIANDPTLMPTIGSTQAWVINNIIAGFSQYGITVDNNSTCDYIGAYNLISSPNDGVAMDYEIGTTPTDPSDIRDVDPLFADPTNADFRLQPGSPAFDAGSAPASSLGLGDSSVGVDGVADSGQVDIGFHQSNITAPIFPVPPITPLYIYVDPDGQDTNDGLRPTTALRTIGQAVERARAVSRIVIAPGVYSDHIGIGALRPAGPVEIYGDVEGTLTGNAPGVVVMDASGQPDGINITGHCSTVIDGIAVTHAKENGMFIKESHRSVLRNNLSLSNGSLGMNIVDVNDVQIVNNLIYANGDWLMGRGGGIQVGASDIGPGCQRTVIESNTIYHNSVDGILIGTGGKASTGTQIRYNIMSGNGKRGLQLDDDTHAGISAAGMCLEYNLNTDTYGPIAPENCALCLPSSGSSADQPDSDCSDFACHKTEAACRLDGANSLTDDPDFAGRVSGADGCLGGNSFWDDDFRLAQPAAGQQSISPAVNYPDEDANEINIGDNMTLGDRTTRTDNVVDKGNLDLGYHYPVAPPQNAPLLPGDCDHDRRVSVSELVRGVHIALDMLPVSSCPEFDTNDDGRVDVAELSAAVAAAMACTGPPAP